MANKYMPGWGVIGASADTGRGFLIESNGILTTWIGPDDMPAQSVAFRAAEMQIATGGSLAVETVLRDTTGVLRVGDGAAPVCTTNDYVFTNPVRATKLSGWDVVIWEASGEALGFNDLAWVPSDAVTVINGYSSSSVEEGRRVAVRADGTVMQQLFSARMCEMARMTGVTKVLPVDAASAESYFVLLDDGRVYYIAGELFATASATIKRVVATGVADMVGLVGHRANAALKHTDGTCTIVRLQSDGLQLDTRTLAAATGVASIHANVSVDILYALKTDGTVVTWPMAFNTLQDVPNDVAGVSAVAVSEPIAGGGGVAIALKSDGTVAAWGINSDDYRLGAVGMTGIAGVYAVAGDSLFCIKTDGSVVAWARAGGDFYNLTVIPDGLTGVAELFFSSTAYALKTDGTVVAWGDEAASLPVGLTGVAKIYPKILSYNTYALHTDGTVTDWGTGPTVPVLASVTDIFRQTWGGPTAFTDYALHADGTVTAWGDNVALMPGGLTGVASLFFGSNTVYALKTDGTVVAWGDEAAAMPALTGVAALTMGGEDRVYARKNDGTAVSWGTFAPSLLGITGVAKIVARQEDSTVFCIKTDGSVVALGNGPTNVPAGILVSDIFVGDAHSFALKTDGTIAKWGWHQGQEDTPGSLTGVADIAIVSGATLALKTDGTVVAWGDNGATAYTGAAQVPAAFDEVYLFEVDFGPVVVGATTGSRGCLAWGSNPDDILGFDKPSTIGAYVDVFQVSYSGVDGAVGLCITTAGNLVAWGDGSAHIVVDAPNLSSVTKIVRENQDRNAYAINNGGVVRWGESASDVPGGATSGVSDFNIWGARFALKADGTVVAWGGSSANMPVLTNVASMHGQGGWFAVQAIHTDGSMTCWQQSTGTDLFPTHPQVTQIFSFWWSGFALTPTGGVLAWGSSNAYGQHNVPGGLTGVSSIVTSDNENTVHALKADGTVVTWGRDFYDAATAMSGVNGVTNIYTDGSEFFALKSDGTVVHAGSGSIPALTDVAALSVAGGEFFAIKTDGTVQSFGSTSWGKNQVPPGLNGVDRILQTNKAVVAVCTDGTVAAWGDNGDTALSDTPEVDVPILATDGDVAWLAKGAPRFLRNDGLFAYPGGNMTGVVRALDPGGALVWDGTSILQPGEDTPIPLKVPDTFAAFAYGGAAGVALRADGTVKQLLGTAPGTAPTGVVAVYAHAHEDLTFAQDASGNLTSWGTYSISGTAVTTGVAQLAIGQDHCLVLKTDDTVEAWGDNTHGQCDIVPGLTAKSVLAGANNSAVVTTADTVFAWGENNYGQCNVPDDLAHVAIASFLNTSSSNAEVHGMVAVRLDGSLAWWGQVTGGTPQFPQPRPFTASAPSVTGIVGGYTAREDHGIPGIARIVETGELHIWGTPQPNWVDSPVALYAEGEHLTVQNADGALVEHDNWWSAYVYYPRNASIEAGGLVAVGGNFNVVDRGTASSVLQTHGASPPGSNGLVGGVDALAAGLGHFLVLYPSGLVDGWGDNTSGQLPASAGAGELVNVAQIEAGGNNSLVVRNDGTVYVWGDNSSGQNTVPGGLTGVAKARIGCRYGHAFETTAYSVGATFVVVVKTDGTVVSWGADPTLPGGLTDIADVQCGDQFVLALKTDGTVVAWGTNASGQTDVPVGLTGVTDIAATNSGAYALKSDGTIVHWGIGPHPFLKPVEPIARYAVSGTQCMVIGADGAATMWGYGWAVKDGSPFNGFYSTPLTQDLAMTAPAGLATAKQVLLGPPSFAGPAAAVLADGSLVTWYPYTVVASGIERVEVSGGVLGGSASGLALKADGTLVWWGSTADVDGRDTVPAMTGVTAFSSEGQHGSIGAVAAAVDGGGTVHVWGDGSATFLPVPVDAAGAVDIVVVAHPTVTDMVAIIALKDDGTLVVWGPGADYFDTGATGVTEISKIGSGLAMVVPS